jgi:hypothetical protein
MSTTGRSRSLHLLDLADVDDQHVGRAPPTGAPMRQSPACGRRAGSRTTAPRDRARGRVRGDPLAQRARAELTAGGGRPPRLESEGVAALTPAERRAGRTRTPEPRNRPAAVRHREDRRGACQPELPQARHPLALAAGPGQRLAGRRQHLIAQPAAATVEHGGTRTRITPGEPPDRADATTAPHSHGRHRRNRRPTDRDTERPRWPCPTRARRRAACRLDAGAWPRPRSSRALPKSADST